MFRLLGLWLCFASAFSCFSKELQASEDFDYQPEQSFQLSVGPRSFQNRDFGQAPRFSRISKPLVSLKFSPYLTSFGLEPAVSLGYVTNSSKELSGSKNTYHLFQFATGLRYRFWQADFYPLIPYVETNLVYRLMRFKTRTGASTSDANGGELGVQAGMGLKLSFTAANSSLRNEMRDSWSLEDFGLDLNFLYETKHFFRHGSSFKSLASLEGLSPSLGLYVDW